MQLCLKWTKNLTLAAIVQSKCETPHGVGTPEDKARLIHHGAGVSGTLFVVTMVALIPASSFLTNPDSSHCPV